jgi:hypothetical protein
MQREAWIDGGVAAQWPAAMCDGALQTLTPWERKVLEEPWGFTRIRLARLCRLRPQRRVDRRKPIIAGVRHLNHGVPK